MQCVLVRTDAIVGPGLTTVDIGVRERRRRQKCCRQPTTLLPITVTPDNNSSGVFKLEGLVGH